VEGVIELKLTDHELADFRASCDTLKKAMDTL
jgi:malate/lactate dehydrogenase